MQNGEKVNIVTVRGMNIGEGCPKICVPIVEKTKDAILKAASEMHNLSVDIVEWRADWFEQVEDVTSVLDVLRELRKELNNIPILFTFRTLAEGGERPIEVRKYFSLLWHSAQSGYVDMVDLELTTAGELAKTAIEALHKQTNVKVVMSSHNFTETPSQQVIVDRMRQMQDLDADICKIAVMPHSSKDVLTLLGATDEMYTQYANRPIVTMSMSSKGVISRIAGETFGSAITFGAAQRASAPGQLNVEDLDRMLHILHGCNM